MMKTFILLFTLFVSQAALSVSDADIKKSLKQMEDSGMFTSEQLKAASDKLNSMTPEQRQALVAKGREKLNDPAIQKKAKEMLEKYKAQQNLKGK